MSTRSETNVMAMLERLAAVFGMPQNLTEEATPKFFAEYVSALAGFDAVTLRKAGDRALRHCKWWPKPAELIDFCEAALPVTSGDSEAHRMIRSRDEMVKQAAREYMMHCKSSLIDMAMSQGWGRSLEDVARDVIRRCYDRDSGRLPTREMMMEFRLPRDVVEYYSRHGQSHLNYDVAMIMAARGKGPKVEPLQPISREEAPAVTAALIENMKSAGKISGEASKAQWERGRQAEFEAMQEASPNAVHRQPLPQTSKRGVGGRP